MTQQAKQGFRYTHRGEDVIAMESGAGFVKVRVIDPYAPLCIGRAYYAPASELVPVPMKYFQGEVPN